MTPQQFQSLVDALTVVLPGTSPADASLKYFFRTHSKLGSGDRSFVAENVYAILRRRRLVEYLVPDGNPRRMALAGLLQLQSQSVEQLKPWLRKGDEDWLARQRSLAQADLPFEVDADLPFWVIARLRAHMQDTDILALARSLQSPAPLDLRVNTFRTRREAVIEALMRDGIAAKPTKYSPIGVRLDEKIALNRHPLFVSGDIEVQDEGSQLLGLLVEARRGEMVVDFCAGAGGKSLLIGAAMHSQGRVYAMDVSAKRLANLSPRLKRSGLSNLFPIRIDSENDIKVKRLAGKIDRVLVDAPCSGLGTLRRNPDLKTRQTEEGLLELLAKQRSILNSAARLLKPGGRLVYGTCSLLREENEDLVSAFLKEHPEYSLSSAADALARQKVSIPGMGEFLSISPDKHATDGFFAAVMTRGAK